jgi:catechol 2,3-dioxygenase
MIRPDRIGHVAIRVRDLDRSCKFYSEVLGLQLMKEVPELRAAFFSSGGRDHHEMALLEAGSQAGHPRANEIRMLHVAFRLQSEEDLRNAYQEIKARGIPISFTVNHGVSKSIYFQDPDGHGIELYCDNRPEEYAHMPNPYLGMDKLDFAPNDPGVADVLAQGTLQQ